MRIAFLTPVYPPMVSGASLVIHRLAEGMTARGHTVLVITASDRSIPYCIQKPNIAVLRLRSLHNPLRVEQRLVIWPHTEVIRALDEFSPDILHVSDPIQLAIPALQYSRRNRIPNVYSIQQLPWFITSYLPEMPWLKNALEKVLWTYGTWLIRQFDAVVTPTKTIANVVRLQTGMAPYVISNGVDLDTFKPAFDGHDTGTSWREKLGIPLEAPIILHVGRLDKDKQVDTAIHASALTIRHTKAHLLVVGDGKERPKLARLCVELGIEHQSHFTGFMSAAEGLADMYRLASVFVITSQIETQGIVLLEAAACGIPIVATHATCIPEIVLNEINGYLVPSGKTKEMGDFLTRLIQEPDRAARMGKAGRGIVLRHSIEYTLDNYENLLFKYHAAGRNWNKYPLTGPEIEGE